MLEILFSLKKYTCKVAVKAKKEYSKFLSHVVKNSKEVFPEYDETKIPLDTFLWKYIRSDPKFKSLWIVTKIILVLSHGQATVEIGFSENKMPHVEK